MRHDSALIFDIHRGTTHDGPGLRSTAFFKGCPLNCLWCHNPEGILPQQQIWWDSAKCIGCLSCQGSCGYGSIYTDESGIHIDDKHCVRCLQCVKVCPSKALSPIGRYYTLEEAAAELLKDKDYYKLSGGGITVSGGEPMLQHDFILNLFVRMKEEHVTTALDTCGYARYEDYARLFPYTDYFLYDIKLFDDAAHQRYTGKSNQLILDNFKKLIEAKRSGDGQFTIWVRTPLIPNTTASEENLTAIAHLLSPYLGNEVERWELCAFNNSCVRKYRKLEQDWYYAQERALKREEADQLLQCILDKGLDPSRVILTGILV